MLVLTARDRDVLVLSSLTIPLGCPNQTPNSNRVFATRRMADDQVVDGKTFQAYSIPMIKASLRKLFNSHLKVVNTRGPTLIQRDNVSSMLKREFVAHTMNRIDSEVSERTGFLSGWK